MNPNFVAKGVDGDDGQRQSVLVKECHRFGKPTRGHFHSIDFHGRIPQFTCELSDQFSRRLSIEVSELQGQGVWPSLDGGGNAERNVSRT